MTLKRMTLFAIFCLCLTGITACVNDGVKDGHCCQQFAWLSAQADEYNLDKNFVDSLCLDSKEMEGLTPNVNVFDYDMPEACQQLPENEQSLMLPCTSYVCSDTAIKQLMIFDEQMQNAVPCCKSLRPEFYKTNPGGDDSWTQEQNDAVEKYHQCFKDYLSTKTCANENK